MPPQFSVRLEGEDKVRVGLNRFECTLEPISKADLKAMMERARKTTPAYQGGAEYAIPERGDYERTGNLGRSVDIIEDGLTVRIEVNAFHGGTEYGPFVLGRGDGSGQAWWHAGRWPTMRSAVDDELDWLTATIDDDLQASVEAAGL